MYILILNRNHIMGMRHDLEGIKRDLMRHVSTARSRGAQVELQPDNKTIWVMWTDPVEDEEYYEIFKVEPTNLEGVFARL